MKSDTETVGHGDTATKQSAQLLFHDSKTVESTRLRVPGSPRLRVSLWLLLALSVFVQTTTAQFLPTDARALNSSRVPFLFASTSKPSNLVPVVEQVGAIGMTVSDMDASVNFYSKVLSFEKVSDVEVTGEDYERLQGRLWPAHACGANAPGE